MPFSPRPHLIAHLKIAASAARSWLESPLVHQRHGWHEIAGPLGCEAGLVQALGCTQQLLVCAEGAAKNAVLTTQTLSAAYAQAPLSVFSAQDLADQGSGPWRLADLLICIDPTGQEPGALAAARLAKTYACPVLSVGPEGNLGRHVQPARWSLSAARAAQGPLQIYVQSAFVMALVALAAAAARMQRAGQPLTPMQQPAILGWQNALLGLPACLSQLALLLEQDGASRAAVDAASQTCAAAQELMVVCDRVSRPPVRAWRDALGLGAQAVRILDADEALLGDEPIPSAPPRACVMVFGPEGPTQEARGTLARIAQHGWPCVWLSSCEPAHLEGPMVDLSGLCRAACCGAALWPVVSRVLLHTVTPSSNK